MLRLVLFFASLFALLPEAAAQALPFPPAAQVRLAVNQYTQKAYATDEFNNQVIVFDATGQAIRAIPVGSRPQYIAADPASNRVYVVNAGDASLSIIDGASDTTLGAARGIGSTGPVTVNPVTGIVFIVRFTSPATDEVTLYDPANDRWYTMATNSWQPISMSIDPVNNEIYVAHYAGHLAVISGAYNEANDFPYTDVFNMGQRPFAVTMNPVTRMAYVILDDTSAPIAIVDGNASRIPHGSPTRANNPPYDPPRNPSTFPAVTSGHGISPKGLALNPATNRVYAAFANEIIVIDGATNALRYIPASTGSGPVAVAIDQATNKIYVAADNGVLTILDGDSETTTTATIPTGATSLGVNPITHQVLAYGTALTVLQGAPGSLHALPLTTSIAALPGDRAGTDATFTLDVTGTYSPGLPARAAYYRLDSLQGGWLRAQGSGPFTAQVTGLSGGSHTLYAFSVDGQDSPLSTGPQSHPRIGAIASYTFTVGGTASVSLATSVNPSRVGQPVTFTASVSGSGGTPSGTVRFLDGADAIAGCEGVTIASGTASCTSSALAAGTHAISARYAGDTMFGPATSSTVSQAVQKNTAAAALSSSANPAVVGTAITFTATVTGSGGTPSGTVRFSEGGTALGGCEAIALSGGAARCTASNLALGTHDIVASYSGDAAFTPAASAALSQDVREQPVPGVALSRTSIDFGGQSMNTTAPAQTVTLTNTGTATLTVSGVVITGSGAGQFAQGNDCGSVAPSASCTISVTFTPAAVSSAGLNTSTAVAATLAISSDAASSPDAVALAGQAEKSLVTHFYKSILQRAADDAGKQFWMDETSRVVGLGVSVNEAWYALAQAFYGSAEYQALGRSDDGYVSDLYRTFFNREADDSGKAFWVSNLRQGMPREVLLAQFLFSPEFASFTRSIFGDTGVRAEIDMTGDFYRGLMGRLPDSAGFPYWLGQFRDAQCKGGDAVRGTADTISSQFIGSAEYANRGRTNAQFVGDLYNAFLRRGGDLDGAKYWIGQLDAGMSREAVRRQFVASAEFSNRVQAVTNQGCLAG